MIEHRLDARPAGVRDLLAQPGRAATPTGASTPTRPRCVEALDAVAGDHRRRTRPTCSACAPAASCSRPSPRTSPPRASRTGSPGSPSACACWTTTRPAPRARSWSTAQVAALADGRLGAQAATSTGQSLAGVFAWLRPNDLIWNYWVNNYLLGKDAAGLRHPVLERRLHQPAGRAAPRLPARCRSRTRSPSPAQLTVLGTPIDLSKITVDTYVVAGHRRPHHRRGRTPTGR